MFKNISTASNILILSINLECTRLIPMYFNKAVRELHPLQKVQDLTLNVSNNSMREEGVYAVADLCCNMANLASLKVYFRKYLSEYSVLKFQTKVFLNSSNQYQRYKL